MLTQRLGDLEDEVTLLEETEEGEQSELYASELLSSLKDLQNKLENMFEQDIDGIEENQVKNLLTRVKNARRELVLIKENIIETRIESTELKKQKERMVENSKYQLYITPCSSADGWKSF